MVPLTAELIVGRDYQRVLAVRTFDDGSDQIDEMRSDGFEQNCIRRHAALRKFAYLAPTEGRPCGESERQSVQAKRIDDADARRPLIGAAARLRHDW